MDRVEHHRNGIFDRCGEDPQAGPAERIVIVELPSRVQPMSFMTAMLLDVFFIVKIAAGGIAAICVARALGMLDWI